MKNTSASPLGEGDRAAVEGGVQRTFTLNYYRNEAQRLIIFPAIDIQNGNCVRLKKGIASDSTVYGTDPVQMAEKWAREGACYLHVVDLDGAFKGSGQNTEAIRKICAALSIPVEVGGGIRTEEAVKAHLDNGVTRVIIGSAAVEHPSFAVEMAKKYGKEHIAVSIDAKGNMATTHGWVDGSGKEVLPFAEELVAAGVSTIIYTDISRDGMLTGPNFEMLGKLQNIPGISLIASGGMSSAEDLRKLSAMGLCGAICGKALYEGKVSMEEIRKIQN